MRYARLSATAAFIAVLADVATGCNTGFAMVQTGFAASPRGGPHGGPPWPRRDDRQAGAGAKRMPSSVAVASGESFG